MPLVLSPAQHGGAIAMTSSKTPESKGSIWESGYSSALLHLIHAGVTCAAVLGLKIYRTSRQRAAAETVKTPSVESQLAAARAELAAKEEQLRALQHQVAQQRFSQDQSEELEGLRQRLKTAQEELLAAGQRCREASERMARTACDLAVTETELRAHKAQLQQASHQLQEMQSRLEDAQGELGLTRSQNLMMQREVSTLRRQLRDAGTQLEGHLAERAAWGHGMDLGLD